MSLIGAAVTRCSVGIVRTMRSFPGVVRAYLPMAYDYIDWRWSDTHISKTEFGAGMRCRLNDLIQRKISYFGVWEPNLTDFFYGNLRPGDVVIDVGANIGYFTLLAASIVGTTGRVISIEASPQIFGLLAENIEMNRLSNVRAVNCAAAYADGEMSVYASGEDNIGHSSTIPLDDNKFIGTVKARPLHDILTSEELSRVRLVKIDIEGAERPVIESILEHLDLYGPDCEIAVEVSVENNDLFAVMAARGFKAYQLKNDYSDEAYIGRHTQSPIAFTGTIKTLSDFIFSRRDVDILTPTVPLGSPAEKARPARRSTL